MKHARRPAMCSWQNYAGLCTTVAAALQHDKPVGEYLKRFTGEWMFVRVLLGSTQGEYDGPDEGKRVFIDR